MVAISQNIVQSLTGSSLDIQKLATDLVSAVRAPQQADLDTKKTLADAKVSSIGKIMSSASGLKSALSGYGDPKSIAFTPVADPNASFTFHVGSPARTVDLSFQVNNVATKNQVMLAGLAGGGSMAGELGDGSLKINYTDSTGRSAVQSFDLTQYATLTDLQTAIQGVTGFDAQIVATGSGTNSLQYLTITHGTGAANNFTVETVHSSDGTILTDGLQTKAGANASSGTDASLTYNGVTFTSPTNTFSNFVPDLQITLNASMAQSTTPTNVHLQTTSNTAGCKQALDDIVAAYNGLLKTLQTEITYDKDATKRGGLANDPVARSLLNQMRALSTDPITLANGKSVTMADVGVRTNQDGSLMIDTTQFNTVMANSPGLLESVISSGKSAGALERFMNLTDVITGPTSSLKAESDTATNTDLAKIATAQQKLNDAMDALQARYLQQFSDMQTIVNASKTTQDSLTQSMQAWTAGLKA